MFFFIRCCQNYIVSIKNSRNDYIFAYVGCFNAIKNFIRFFKIDISRIDIEIYVVLSRHESDIAIGRFLRVQSGVNVTFNGTKIRKLSLVLTNNFKCIVVSVNKNVCSHHFGSVFRIGNHFVRRVTKVSVYT